MTEASPQEATWWEPLSEAQLATLARITLLWARIDDQLDMIACLHLRMPIRTWDAFVGDMTAPGKAALLIRICGEKDDASTNEVRGIARAVSATAGKRNLATHGHWNVDQPAGRVCARSRRKKEPLYVEELEPLEAELSAIDDQATTVQFNLLQRIQVHKTPA